MTEVNKQRNAGNNPEMQLSNAQIIKYCVNPNWSHEFINSFELTKVNRSKIFLSKDMPATIWLDPLSLLIGYEDKWIVCERAYEVR